MTAVFFHHLASLIGALPPASTRTCACFLKTNLKKPSIPGFIVSSSIRPKTIAPHIHIATTYAPISNPD